VLHNLLHMTMNAKYGGEINCGEIGLPITKSGLKLPCGILGRWESK
jgi:23S rRNA (cytosine1962-C5)-methyltransferase